MSSLRVATVTFVLSQLLGPAASRAVSGAIVTTKRPDTPENGSAGPSINIFLYSVQPNPAWHNADLPTRRSDGTLQQHPIVALDLHYLLTFFGDESNFEPQRLLGSAMSTLHTEPILTQGRIRDTIEAATNPNTGDPDHPLANSDLHEQVERVKFSLLPLNLEELSKLWSVFFQVPYALSVAYQASVVLIVEADPKPQSALPVRERQIFVRPFRQIVIDRIVSEAGPDQPIHLDSTLLLQGKHLRGEIMTVQIASVQVPPEALTLSGTQISLPLTSITPALRAGVLGVQVIHLLEPNSPHLRFTSNIAPFVLRPRIEEVSFVPTGNSGGPEVEVRLAPSIRPAQRLLLLLNELGAASPQAYSIEASPPDEDSEQINIPIPEVESGEYLVRIQVDGAESVLEVDENPDSPTFNQYIDPTVTIP